MRTILTGLLALLVFSGDGYANGLFDKIKTTDWDTISVGMEKPIVVRILGMPDKTESSDIMGIKTEHLIYVEHFPEKTFQVDFVLDRVVSKSSTK